MPSTSFADKKAKGLVSGNSRKSMKEASKHLEKSRSQWKETTNRWANEQRARNGGYKKHRKPRLLFKVLLVGLLLCGGSLVAWKAGVFSEEISRKFGTFVVYLSNTLDNVIIYLQGLWPSNTDVTPAEDPPDPLNAFVSVDDLVRFLDIDNVSDAVYASEFKCGDFAEALVNRAHDAGYNMNVYSMFDSELDDFTRYVETLEYVEVNDGTTTTFTFSYGLGDGHAVCKIIINSVAYLIEPQDDMVFEVIEDGYDVVYFGEVTK